MIRPSRRRVWAAGALAASVGAGVFLGWAAADPATRAERRTALERFARRVNALERARLHHRLTRAAARLEADRLTDAARRGTGCDRIETRITVGSAWDLRWAQERSLAVASADGADLVAVATRAAGFPGRIPQPFVNVVAGAWDC